MAPAFWAAVLGFALAATAPAMADEAPKFGGILIPADAPPSFDARRDGTFATSHSAAPFYSVLIRVDPDNPPSTTDFVCDLCAAVPQATPKAALGVRREKEIARTRQTATPMASAMR
jgi:peptide/nickel transport system substrate-binding protein